MHPTHAGWSYGIDELQSASMARCASKVGRRLISTIFITRVSGSGLTGGLLAASAGAHALGEFSFEGIHLCLGLKDGCAVPPASRADGSSTPWHVYPPADHPEPAAS